MKVGICFSGGGVKGIAHLGVLKYLLERDIEPEIVSGTSAGAIVGAFYAYGYSPEESLEIFKEIHIFSIPHLAFGRPGIFNIYRIRKQLESYFDHSDFNQLEKQLYIHTTDLQSGKEVIFYDGDLIKAVFASAAIPFLFAPIIIDDTLFTDGGVCNNFPIESIMGKCDVLIGLNVEMVSDRDKKELSNPIRIIERAMQIMINKQSREKIHYCDAYLEFPELSKYSIIDFKKMDEIFEIGYRKAKSNEQIFDAIMPVSY